MARPRIEIDKEQFEKLCALQCTRIEIAGFFNCSEDTIERWCERTYHDNFAVIFAQKRQVGKISLRRNQWKMSEHNVSMAIWLGKQYLGQKEQHEVKIEGNLDEAVREMDAFFEGVNNDETGCD